MTRNCEDELRQANPQLVEFAHKIDAALDQVINHIDDAEEAGYVVRLFTVPDGDGRPTFGINISPKPPHPPDQSIWLCEIEV